MINSQISIISHLNKMIPTISKKSAAPIILKLMMGTILCGLLLIPLAVGLRAQYFPQLGYSKMAYFSLDFDLFLWGGLSVLLYQVLQWVQKLKS